MRHGGSTPATPESVPAQPRLASLIRVHHSRNSRARGKSKLDPGLVSGTCVWYLRLQLILLGLDFSDPLLRVILPLLHVVLHVVCFLNENGAARAHFLSRPRSGSVNHS